MFQSQYKTARSYTMVTADKGMSVSPNMEPSTTASFQLTEPQINSSDQQAFLPLPVIAVILGIISAGTAIIANWERLDKLFNGALQPLDWDDRDTAKQLQEKTKEQLEIYKGNLDALNNNPSDRDAQQRVIENAEELAKRVNDQANFLDSKVKELALNNREVGQLPTIVNELREEAQNLIKQANDLKKNRSQNSPRSELEIVPSVATKEGEKITQGSHQDTLILLEDEGNKKLEQLQNKYQGKQNQLSEELTKLERDYNNNPTPERREELLLQVREVTAQYNDNKAEFNSNLANLLEQYRFPPTEVSKFRANANKLEEFANSVRSGALDQEIFSDTQTSQHNLNSTTGSQEPTNGLPVSPSLPSNQQSSGVIVQNSGELSSLEGFDFSLLDDYGEEEIRTALSNLTQQQATA
jgi:hypothetical protein